MRVENEAAYVLEARPYRETSLLVELLTAEHGRIAAVARGVRGESKRQRLRRALLEPFQRLIVGFSGRGEVLSLGAVESISTPLRPAGAALFAALYVNELVQKLTGRGDPVPGLFHRYGHWFGQMAGILTTASARGTSASQPETSQGDALAWSLRCFERDLLAELGYALALDHASDSGEAIRPDLDYAFDPAHGAVLWHAGSVWPRVRGSTLLAWAGERLPEADTGRALKRVARVVIRHHLGGAELRAWRLAAEWAGS